MAEIVTQQNMRMDRNARDQFGRLWLMSVEKKTNQPCGGIDSAGWSDPLKTPQKYLKVPKNEFGQFDSTRLDVRDKEWIIEQERAEREWRRSLLEIAQQKSPGGFTVETVEQNEWFMMLAGPKPWPSSAALKAAFIDLRPGLLGLEPLDADDRALLGLETLEDIEATVRKAAPPPEPTMPEPGLTWPEFYAFHAKHNKLTLKDCQPLWKQYKAAAEA